MRIRAFLLALAGALLLAPALLAALLSGDAAGPPVLLNLSGSAPEGLYLRTGRPAAVGEWVAACLPEELARFGRARVYVAAGACPGGAAPLLKRLAAAEGSRIEQTAAGLSIDGRLFPRSAPREKDSRGRALPVTVSYPYTVPSGEVLLLNEHSLSWDGRYFGPVPGEALLGVYRPVVPPAPRELPRGARPRGAS